MSTITTKFIIDVDEKINTALRTLSEGFSKVGEQLKKFAKDSTDLKSVSTVFVEVANSLSSLTVKEKELEGVVIKTSAAIKNSENSLRIITEAYDFYSDKIGKGIITTKEAEAEARKYGNAMQILGKDVVKAGGTLNDYNNSISFTEVKQLELNGALKVTGTGFVFNADSAYKAFIKNEELRGSVKKLHDVYKDQDAVLAKLKNSFQVLLEPTSGYAEKTKELLNSLNGSREKYTEVAIALGNLKKEYIASEKEIIKQKEVHKQNEIEIKKLEYTYRGILDPISKYNKYAQEQIEILRNNAEAKTDVRIALDTLLQKQKEETAQQAKDLAENNRITESIAKLKYAYADLFTVESKYNKQAQEQVQILEKNKNEFGNVKRALDTYLKSQEQEQKILRDSKKEHDNLILNLSKLELEYGKLFKAGSFQKAGAEEQIRLYLEENKDITLVKGALKELTAERDAQTAAANKEAVAEKNLIISYEKLLSKYDGFSKLQGKRKLQAEEEIRLLVMEGKSYTDVSFAINKLVKTQNDEIKFQDNLIKNINRLVSEYVGLFKVGSLQKDHAEEQIRLYREEGKDIYLVRSALKELKAERVSQISEVAKSVKAEDDLLKSYNRLIVKYDGFSKLQGKRKLQAEEEIRLLVMEGKSAADVELSIQKLVTAQREEFTSSAKTLAEKGRLTESIAKLKYAYGDLFIVGGKFNAQSNDQIKILEKNKNEFGNVKRALSTYLKELKEAESQNEKFNAARDSADKFAKSIQNIEREFKSVLGPISVVNGAMNKNADEANRLFSEYKKGIITYAELRRSLNGHLSDEKKAKTANDKLAIAIQKLYIEYGYLSKAGSIQKQKFDEEIRAAVMLDKEISLVTANIKKLATEYRHALNATDVFNRKTKETEAAQDGLSKAFGTLTGRIKSYFQYILVSNIFMQVGQSLRELTMGVIDHDQALHNLTAITQSTAKETHEMDLVMMSLSNTTQFSAREIGDAMAVFAQAGADAKDVIAGTADIVNLAVAAGESLDSAVALVTTAMNSYDISMSQISQTADIFANAITKSKLSIAGMNTTMNYIGVYAHEAGLSIKETAGAAMLLSNAGIRFSTIGTGMRQVLNQLMKPTKNFQDAILAAGYTVNDFNPMVSKFSDVIARLPDVVKNSGDAINMFSIRGAAAVQALSTQGSKLKGLMDSLDAVGTASEMSGEQLKGLGNIVKNIQAQFANLGTYLGKAGLEGILSGVLTGVQSLLKGINEFLQTGLGRTVVEVGVVITSLTALAFAFKGVIYVMGMLKKAFITNILGFVVFNPAIAAVIAGLSALAAIIVYARTQQNDLSVELENSVDASNKYVDSLQSIKEAVGLYISVTKDLSDSTKESIKSKENVITTLQNLKKEYDNTIVFDKYIVQLKDLNLSFSEQKKVIDEVSIVLGDIHRKALLESIKNTEVLYERQKKLKTDAEKSKEFFKNMAGAALAVPNAIIYLIKSFTGHIEKSKVAVEAYSVFIGKSSEEMANLTGKGIHALDAMKKSSKENYDSLHKSVVAYVGSLENVNDIIKMSDKELMIHAANEAKKYGASIEFAGDYVLELFKLKKAFEAARIEEQKSYGSFAKTVEEYKKLANAESETFESKMAHLKEGSEKVQENLQKEQDALAENYRLGVISEAEFQQKKNELTLQGSSALRSLMNASIDAAIKQYKEEMKWVENVHKQKQNLAKDTYKNDIFWDQQAYNKKLMDLDEFSISEDEKRRQSTALLIEYTKKNIARSEEYTAKSIELIHAEFEAKNVLHEKFAAAENSITDKVNTNSINSSKRHTEAYLKSKLEELNAVKSNLEQQKTDYLAYLGVIRARETELTSKIKAEAESRKNFTKSMEDMIRGIKYKTFSDEKIQRLETERVDRLLSEASVLRMKGKYDEALKKIGEAATAQNSIATSIDRSKESAETYNEKMATQVSRMEKIEGIGRRISKQKEDEMENEKSSIGSYANTVVEKVKSIDDAIKNTTESIKEIGLENLKFGSGQIEAIVQGFKTMVGRVEDLTETIKECKAAKDELDKAMARSETTGIQEKQKEVSETSRRIQAKKRLMDMAGGNQEVIDIIEANPEVFFGLNSGGAVPGIGSEDTVPAMLTPGEFVVKKDVVAQHGVKSLLEDLNDGTLQKFAAGGTVGVSSATKRTLQTTALNDADFQKMIRDLEYKTLTEDEVKRRELQRLSDLESEAQTYVTKGDYVNGAAAVDEAMSLVNQFANALDKSKMSIGDYTSEIQQYQRRLSNLQQLKDTMNVSNISTTSNTEQQNIEQYTAQKETLIGTISQKVQSKEDLLADTTAKRDAAVQKRDEQIAKKQVTDLKTKQTELTKDKTEIVNDYKKYLKYYEEYTARKQEIADNSYQNELNKDKDLYDEKLRGLDQFGAVEEEKIVKTSELNIDYYDNLIKKSDEYYEGLTAIQFNDVAVKKDILKIISGDEQEYADAVESLNRETYEKQKGFLEQRKSVYISVLNELKSQESDFTTSIRSENETRKSFQESLNDTLRNLTYKGYDDSSRVKDAEEKRATALKAEAEVLLKSSNFVEAKKKIEEAMSITTSLSGGTSEDDIGDVDKYKKKLVELSEVWNTISIQNEEFLTAQNDVIKKKMKDTSSDISEIDSQLQQTIADISASELNINTSAAVTQIKGLDEELLKITDSIATVEDNFGDVTAAITASTNQITSLNSMIRDLTKEVDGYQAAFGDIFQKDNALDLSFSSMLFRLDDLNSKISMAKTSIGNLPDTAGTSSKNFGSGGSVPGVGSGDTVPAMLEPGEFITKKDVVAKPGVRDFLEGLNNGEVQGFATGGYAEKASSKRQNKRDSAALADLRRRFGYIPDEDELLKNRLLNEILINVRKFSNTAPIRPGSDIINSVDVRNIATDRPPNIDVAGELLNFKEKVNRGWMGIPFYITKQAADMVNALGLELDRGLSSSPVDLEVLKAVSEKVRMIASPIAGGNREEQINKLIKSQEDQKAEFNTEFDNRMEKASDKSGIVGGLTGNALYEWKENEYRIKVKHAVEDAMREYNPTQGIVDSPIPDRPTKKYTAREGDIFQKPELSDIDKLDSERDSVRRFTAREGDVYKKGGVSVKLDASGKPILRFTSADAEKYSRPEDKEDANYWLSLNSGGSVPGMGSKDIIPAMLTPGEFVIKKDAASKIGIENLTRMNNGESIMSKFFSTIQRYAQGGQVLSSLKAGTFNRLENTKRGIENSVNNFRQQSMIPETAGPSHSITFNFGGEQHGPFKSDGMTMNNFLDALKRDQRRS